MVKRGDIKSEQDLIKFAKQQFGESRFRPQGQIKDILPKVKLQRLQKQEPRTS